jgi:hypothetical protein
MSGVDDRTGNDDPDLRFSIFHRNGLLNQDTDPLCRRQNTQVQEPQVDLTMDLIKEKQKEDDFIKN